MKKKENIRDCYVEKKKERIFKKTRRRKNKEFRRKIEKLENMGIIDYLKYTKDYYKKKKKKEEEESTIDESIEKIIKIKNMINQDPIIKYEIEF